MTHFGTYLFSVGTHRRNLLISSRFSTGDLNFCVHSIPLWEPSCVEKRVMLRASMHRPVGGALSIYVNVKSADTSAVGKLMTAQVWHKAEQIIQVNLAFSHAWMSDYIGMYICLLV